MSGDVAFGGATLGCGQIADDAAPGSGTATLSFPLPRCWVAARSERANAGAMREREVCRNPGGRCGDATYRGRRGMHVYTYMVYVCVVYTRVTRAASLAWLGSPSGKRLNLWLRTYNASATDSFLQQSCYRPTPPSCCLRPQDEKSPSFSQLPGRCSLLRLFCFFIP